MARFACKSSSTLSHCLSVINLAIQRFNSKKEQEETRRLRITHRVSLVSKTTRGEPLILLLAISSFGFVGLALLGVELNQIPRLNQRLNHRSSGARLNISRWQRRVQREEEPRQCSMGITGRLGEGWPAHTLVRTARNLPSSPEHKKTNDEWGNRLEKFILLIILIVAIFS